MHSTKTHVLIIQPWLDYRGAETLSWYLTTDLPHHNIDTAMLCAFVKEIPEEGTDLDHRIITPPAFLADLLRIPLLFYILAIPTLFFLLLKHAPRYDILNPHNFPTYILAVCVAKIKQKKVIWTVHNFPQHPFRGLVGKAFETITAPLDKKAVSAIDRVITVSKKVSAEATALYGCQSTVIYPGINTEYFAKHIQQTPTLEKKYIIFVGQIRPEKKPEIAIRLLQQLVAKGYDIDLVMIGEVKRNPSIPEEIHHKVHLLGKKSKKDLATYYHHAEFVLTTSIWGEGCNLVPLEALASGVKGCLVPRNSGIDEMLSTLNPEWIYDVENSEEVLSKAEKMLNSIPTTPTLAFIDKQRFIHQYVDEINHITQV